MDIHLENIGKKYNRSWVFKGISHCFESGTSYALTGGNGSGKSTLLQIVSGFQSPSIGEVYYSDAVGAKIKPEEFYRHISIAAPYMELPEEFTLLEMIRFHAQFKTSPFSVDEIVEKLELERERNKEIKDFSSGMKQRLKLSLALFFNAEIILLDEPATNLDAKATQWYRDMVQEHSQGKTLLISSNQDIEFDFCRERLHIEDFKK